MNGEATFSVCEEDLPAPEPKMLKASAKIKVNTIFPALVPQHWL
jgi:hypothetical protein